MSRNWIPALLAVGLIGMVASCKKHPQPTITEYPNSSRVNGYNHEEPEGVFFWTQNKTSDSVNVVRSHYETMLSTRPGWHQVGFDWLSDNSTQSGEAVDKTQPSGKVSINEARNSVVIDIWEWVPAPIK